MAVKVSNNQKNGSKNNDGKNGNKNSSSGNKDKDKGKGGSDKEKKNTDVIKEVETKTVISAVTDISIRPYMRELMIKIRATGLMPNKRIHFFFDNECVDEYITDSNRIYLTEDDANTIFEEAFNDSDVITFGSNTAKVIMLDTHVPDTDDDSVKARKRILHIEDDEDSEFKRNIVFIGSKTGLTGTVANTYVTGGKRLQTWFNSDSDNTIRLARSTAVVPNNYWGTTGSNTIVFIPNVREKKHDPFRGHIVAFNNVTQRLTLANTYASIRGQNPTMEKEDGVRIGWQIQPAVDPNGEVAVGEPVNAFYTSALGNFSGAFYLPAGRFTVGDRIFRIIDNLDNDTDIDVCDTRAEARFTAYGLKTETTDLVLKTVNDTKKKKSKDTPDRPVVNRPDGIDRCAVDPVAQTFFVNEEEYPNGMFLTSVDLFFSSKDPFLPVSVELRPTVNGYPHSTEILEGSHISYSPSQVNTSANGQIATRFTFPNLVKVEAGEYAIVVKTDSNAYRIYVSELGQKIIGTDRIVSEQPYIGSFFKSQNSSTWDPVQLEDLKFVLNRAKFSTSPGTIYFGNIEPFDDISDSRYADVLSAEVWDDVITGTDIDYAHSYDSGATYTDYIPYSEVVPSARIEFANNSNGQYRIRATMSTTDDAISPMITSESVKLFTTTNGIDEASIDQNDIVITNGGSGYIANANIVLALTGTSGSGAVLYAVANALGGIANVYVGLGGSGYLDNISLYSSNGNVSSTITAANGTGATININSETSSSGGPATTKYISRTVTLAEGFDAGDLRVWVSAYKPSGTDIAVYYKVKNNNDQSDFADKPYVRMSQKSLSTWYSLQDDYNDVIEYEFEPSDTTQPITYTSASGTFDTFHQFSIKLVMTSDDTTRYPIIYDMRAVAVPGPDVS